MTILCVLILCADLATAHGSFLLDGWKVWNNASISRDSRVETGMVPVRISLASRQTLWIGAESSIRFEDHRILVEKGSVQLDTSGDYFLAGKTVKGLTAGSDDSEVSRAVHIPRQYESLRELRPMSQRP